MAATKREIEWLYRERYSGFRRALATITGSYESAHDVVQEAFARAIAQRRQFRGDGPLAAWVWRIALRLALEERSRASGVVLAEPLESGLVEPASNPRLAMAFQELPPRRRLIFFLRYFADLSYDEIAVTCGITEGTVAAALHQAREELASLLGKEITNDA